MPVVISMLNAFTGLSAAGAGFVLDNTALIIAGSLVGSSGTLLTILMGRAMNRSLANVLFSAFGAHVAGPARPRPTRATARSARRRVDRRRDDARLRGQGDRRARATGWRSRRRSTACASWPTSSRSAASRCSYAIHPGRRPHARPHERAAGRGRRALHAAEGDGRDQPRVPADRRGARDRRQRRHQPGRARGPEQPDLRHADPRRRQGAGTSSC